MAREEQFQRRRAHASSNNLLTMQSSAFLDIPPVLYGAHMVESAQRRPLQGQVTEHFVFCDRQRRKIMTMAFKHQDHKSTWPAEEARFSPEKGL